MTQHDTLSATRWATFGRDRQILMIANEMNRTSGVLNMDDAGYRRRGYERILRLTDLTIEVQDRRGIRRELLRWRDLIAELYVAEAADPAAHRAAFRVLLQLNPVAARQLEFVLNSNG